MKLNFFFLTNRRICIFDGSLKIVPCNNLSSRIFGKASNISDLVDAHINKFPRVESNYCRRESSCQYLCSDLTLTKMHKMYLSENRQADAVSISFYYKRLKRMNLKFHRPKNICVEFARTITKAMKPRNKHCIMIQATYF